LGSADVDDGALAAGFVVAAAGFVVAAAGFVVAAFVALGLDAPAGRGA
jgi:hypothetical protein